MPSSQSADDIIKKCHDVGEKLMHAGVEASKNVNINTNLSNNNTTGLFGPVHYLHELPLAAEERYAEIFKQLDRNGK